MALKNLEKAKKSFWIAPPELKIKNSKSSIWVEESDFYCLSPLQKIQWKNGVLPHILVGFDTEFKTPLALSASDIKADDGRAKSLILSYQFHAKTHDGFEWSGICCPDGDARLSITEFILFVLGSGARKHRRKDLPTDVYLVGHFTRADIPAFSDFQEMTHYMSALRSTFVTTNEHLKISLKTLNGLPVGLNLYIRDTMLLTPQAKRSLKELGKLVGVEKVELSAHRETYQEMISNMDVVRRENWPLFKAYAMTDAEICLRYIETVIVQYRKITGKFKVPNTLTSIGVDLLLKTWADILKIDPLKILGKESIVQKTFSQKHGHYIKKKVDVDLNIVHWEKNFVTECYHGGRNEQFWFGPCFEDKWFDFDLSSAYPTAMSLIGMPDWGSIKDSSCVDDYAPETLGFAEIEFEFPVSVRYPTLPVRTANGLIFPRKGICYCSAPEIFLARNLGASITIKHGIIVPTDLTRPVFADFTKDCINKRLKAGKSTLEGLFWKEISNSTYGKTAQGLHEKRVYDMRDRDTRRLPASQITNPFFAAFITSFVRAVLGEVINSINDDRMVFSCTTDGFLTNVSPDEIGASLAGPLCLIYGRQRKFLTDDATILEVKHQVKRPLGWRTRGQATLSSGEPSVAGDPILLAKGGIFTAPEYEDLSDQNRLIVNMFFNRTPSTKIVVEAKSGVRDMVEHNADFVEKIFEKRLSMEYDWKRRPYAWAISSKHNHLAFSTVPWESWDEFSRIRDYWDEYNKSSPVCLKSIDDFLKFAQFVEERSFLDSKTARYLKKDNGDVQRLRQQLCIAYKKSVAGLQWKMNGFTDSSFASFLMSHGIPCLKTDVENARKKLFQPYSCPPTSRVIGLLEELKTEIPSLDTEQFLFKAENETGIDMARISKCQFIDRLLVD